MPVGQNIATVQGDSPGLTPLALVDVWYMELLKLNSSVIFRYVPSRETEESHYDYFTQLIWEDSKEVGCGGVKFQERLDVVKYRTIYRLVCNFAPAGNRRNKTVYSCGAPCSECPGVCDRDYQALCEHKATNKDDYSEGEVDDETVLTDDLVENITKPNFRALQDPVYQAILRNTAKMVTNRDTTFDYISHLFDRKSNRETGTPTIGGDTNDARLNDFIELLKKKLYDDPVIKSLMSTATQASAGQSDVTFTDASVAAFIEHIYRNKEASTTIKTTLNDYVNSTLLVDLIEAVIFRGGDKIATTEVQYQDSSLPMVKPVRVQVELPEVKQNKEFTGHYFFPEEEEETSRETIDSYYDTSSLAQSEVEMEIERLKISSVTKDFLDGIFEYETLAESTTILSTLSPDHINLYKSGYSVMKNFLKNVQGTSQKQKIH